MKQNREEILKTIFRLFITRHYENVSYDDMIKATNISKGGLYHYAPNKLELFRLVLDSFFLDLIKIDDDIMVIPSVYDKHILHDFILRYASSCTCVCAAFRISFSFQLAKLTCLFLFSYQMPPILSFILRKNLFSDNKRERTYQECFAYR